MLILLDNCVPKSLKRELPAHTVRHASEMRWEALKDDVLLQSADAANFDLLITADRNMRYQQNLSRYHVGIIVLIAYTNRIQDLRPLIPKLLATLTTVHPGDLHEIRQ